VLEDAKESSRKNVYLDGLRGMAAVNVVIAHFLSGFYPEILQFNYPSIPKSLNLDLTSIVLSSPFLSIFYNGHFAVLVFFVISGFVLTAPYFEGKPKIILTRRLCARYFRLNIPIAASIIFSYFAYSAGMYTLNALTPTGSFLAVLHHENISFNDALKSALYDSILFGIDTFNPPLWSLRVKFIGSIILLVFYIFYRPKISPLPVLIFSLFASVFFKADSVYFQCMLLGSLLNIARPTALIGATSFFVGFYFGAFQYENNLYSLLPNFDYYGIEKKTIYNGLGALLLTWPIAYGYGGIFFSSRVMQFLGKISFSIYLTHYLVLSSVGCFLSFYLPRDRIYISLNFLVYIIECLFLSYLFYRYIDLNAVRLSNTFVKRYLNK
jgi:peptidoglycan/LPS O-acetylase OafA/YrhL